MGGSGGDPSYPKGGSGTGGGSGGSGSGGGNPGADPCAISFQDDLYSPVAGVADRLTSGQVLAVRLTPANAVGVFLDSGTQVGTLAGHVLLPALIGCLDDGVEFAADVVDVTGAAAGRVRLRVRRA
ncbi:hypothetical protein ACSSV6_000403 [Roseovarius sp. MBR-38]|jgi:hypothetical protein